MKAVIEVVSKGRKSLHPITAWAMSTEAYEVRYKNKKTIPIDTSHVHYRTQADINRNGPIAFGGSQVNPRLNELPGIISEAATASNPSIPTSSEKSNSEDLDVLMLMPPENLRLSDATLQQYERILDELDQNPDDVEIKMAAAAWDKAIDRAAGKASSEPRAGMMIADFADTLDKAGAAAIKNLYGGETDAADVYAAATAVQEELDNVARSIAEELGIGYENGKQKTIESMEKKVANHGGDYGLLDMKDHARTHLELNNWDQIPEVLAALDKRNIPYSVEAKATTATGYRGLHITWRSANGLGCEIQVSTPEAWKVKLATDKVYKQWQGMKNADLTPKQAIQFMQDQEWSKQQFDQLDLPDFSIYERTSSSDITRPLSISSRNSGSLAGTQEPSTSSSAWPPVSNGDSSMMRPDSVITNIESSPFPGSIPSSEANVKTKNAEMNQNNPARSYTEQIADFAETMDKAGAMAIKTQYDGVSDPRTYIGDMMQVYKMGRNGTELPNGGYGSLNEPQAQAMYLAGQADAERAQRAQARQKAKADVKAEKKARTKAEKPGLVRDDNFKRAKLTSKETRMLNALARVLGKEIQFVEGIMDKNGREKNAQLKGATIQISLKAQDPYMVCAIHEVVHGIREASESDYQTLAKFVLEHMSDDKYHMAAWAKEKTGYTPADIPEEVVADAFGRMLGDEEAINQFTQEHRNIAQRFFDWLRDIFVKVQRMLDGKYQSENEARQLSELQKNVYSDLSAKTQEMMRLFESALENVQTSGETMQTADKSSGEGLAVKYSISDKLDAELQSVLDDTFPGKQNEVYIGETSNFLVNTIGARSLPVLMPSAKAYSAMVTAEQAKADGRYSEDTNYHGLGKAGLLTA
ncbi:MAG: hypothetical protein IJS31_05490, partial [Oscillospiraceae bacterium]|nr:hypothetical protein [Oscillospiraceae bacterium]